MSREEVKQRLIELIEPLVESRGFELVYLEYVVGKQHGGLHLFIDHENGITVEDCSLISRAVSDLLDLDDPIAHSYTLEVSSPGLERPLTKKAHFVRFQGSKVKIKVREEIDGSSKVSGILQNAENDHVVIKKENNKSLEVPYDLIVRANLWYTKPDKNKILKPNQKGGLAKHNE